MPAGCRELLRELTDAAADPEHRRDSDWKPTGRYSAPAREPDDELLFPSGAPFRSRSIAAVQGVALSGGLALVANAHVVVAAQGTSFGLTVIREGRWHDADVPRRWPPPSASAARWNWP